MDNKYLQNNVLISQFICVLVGAALGFALSYSSSIILLSFALGTLIGIFVNRLEIKEKQQEEEKTKETVVVEEEE